MRSNSSQGLSATVSSDLKKTQNVILGYVFEVNTQFSSKCVLFS